MEVAPIDVYAGKTSAITKHHHLILGPSNGKPYGAAGIAARCAGRGRTALTAHIFLCYIKLNPACLDGAHLGDRNDVAHNACS